MINVSIGHEGANYMYFNLLAAALPANVCFTYYHLALPSNQAVSYSMLQVRILWLTLFSLYVILELSVVLVLELLYICGSGFEIYSPRHPQRLYRSNAVAERLCGGCYSAAPAFKYSDEMCRGSGLVRPSNNGCSSSLHPITSHSL